MEKRIRIVWILSLASVLFLILMQGYWLYNQYVYVLDAYSEELGREILQKTDKEYEIRKAKLKKAYTFMINTNSEYTDNGGQVSKSNKLGFSMIHKQAWEGQELSKLPTDSLFNYFGKQALDSIHSANVLKLSIDVESSQKELYENINRAIVNYHDPFRKELLDSILRADLPDLAYEIAGLPDNDTLYVSRCKRVGSMFAPRMQVSYVYSPFQKEGIRISAQLPTQPLLENMALQLLLALGILLCSLFV